MSAQPQSEAITRLRLTTLKSGAEVVETITDKDEKAQKEATEVERELCGRCGERIGVGRPFIRVTNYAKEKRLFHHPDCTRSL